MTKTEFTFSRLVTSIQKVHNQLAAGVSHAVNTSLTLRNWLIGFYISEFELKGTDRANYGESLLAELSNTLKKQRISNSGRRQLYNYLLFYRAYPEIVRTLSAQFGQIIPEISKHIEKVPTPSAQLTIPPEKLVNRLSYSHFELMVQLDDPLKRTFYELECIKGNWSVRELKRQIGSLYFERSGLSINKEKLAKMAHNGAEKTEPKLAIRDPYIFEFLGLKPKEVMPESALENALLDKLQDFLLELGHGFCFEARQKRLLIGNQHLFVDLVILSPNSEVPRVA